MSNRIITISREYGSGGRLVGQMVAEKLGIPFYDKKLIALVAQKSGFDITFIEETGEYSTTSSRLFNMVMPNLAIQSNYSPETMPMADKLQIIQGNVIRELAEKGPCVIVGRSADYILRHRTDCLNIFIYSDKDHKVERAIQHFGIDPEHVEKELAHKDKLRAKHYKHYTGQTFGMADNYHVSLDSGLLGIDNCRDVIVDIANRL